MINKVGFPGLNLEFTLNRVAFSIFNIDIYWYAIFIASGIVMAYIYCIFKGSKQGIARDTFDDILLCGIPAAVIGGRLYYVAFSWDFYKNNPGKIFAIRDGGLAIYGAIIFAVIAVLIYLKIKKIKPLKIFDICSVGLLIGQAIGRWGNFFNAEAYGSETDSILRMAITDKLTGDMITVHPTFLYESLWNALGIIIINVVINRKKFDGQAFFSYIMWYGFGRMLIESLRADSLYLGAFRISQLVGIISVIGGACAYFILRRRAKGEENE